MQPGLHVVGSKFLPVAVCLKPLLQANSTTMPCREGFTAGRRRPAVSTAPVRLLGTISLRPMADCHDYELVAPLLSPCRPMGHDGEGAHCCARPCRFMLPTLRTLRML